MDGQLEICWRAEVLEQRVFDCLAAEKSLTQLIGTALKFQEPLETMQHAISIRINPNCILTDISAAVAIGMLFARSLHYQFYAYIAFATPFLLWRSGMHPILQFSIWAAQEWAWNVYPSTDVSSEIVVGVLFTMVAGVYWSTRKDFVTPKGVGGAAKRQS